MEDKIKITVINWNDVIPDLSDVFVVKGFPVNVLQSDAIIVSDDIHPRSKRACGIARKQGIPSFVMQHGRNASDHYTRYNRDIIADYFLAWGENDVTQAIEGGWAKDKVIRIGSPILQDKCEYKPDGKTVVFAPIHYELPVSLDLRNRREGMEIWEVLQGMKGIEPVAKLLANEHDIKDYSGYKFVTNRQERGHIKEVYEKLLSKASCVVCNIDSTFDLLAYSMDIPVVRFKDTTLDMYPADNFSASRVVYNLNEIEGAVRCAIAYPEKGKDRRKEVLPHIGGYESDNPKKSIIKLVREKVSDNKR